MKWFEGAFDKYMSKSARWLYQSLMLLVMLFLGYDLFANFSTNSGPISWVQNVILGGGSIARRRLAFVLLLLVGLVGAVVLGFVWDVVTRQGRFAKKETNPYRFVEHDE